MAHTLVYTITTGRSGTMFLSELLRANLAGAEVHHERSTWGDFGLNCPEISHLVRFNNLGNTEYVRDFWRQKLARDAATPTPIYADATHLYAKAGLVENLDLLPDGVRVVLIAQRRDAAQTVWSFLNRMDFVNSGATMLWALDPHYPNRIAGSEDLKQFGTTGRALWYVIEMQARMAYYRRLLEGVKGIDVLDTSLEEIITEPGARRLLETVSGSAQEGIRIPPPANAQQGAFFGEKEKARVQSIVDNVTWDAEELAATYLAQGRRLATPEVNTPEVNMPEVTP